MRSLLVAAPASGQGKTTFTLGLLRALRDRGHKVASGKSGPDYIDPAFHEAATGLPCITMDAWRSSADQIRGRAAMASGADILIVEGAMGLFDGAASGGPVGTGASADVASALDCPVLLVLDAARMAQSAGAIVQGLGNWSPTVRIAGVVLNRCASDRHFAMLKGSIETVCPVLGAIPPTEALSLPSRHLGLVQASETATLEAFIERTARRVADTCDLDAIASIAMGPAASSRAFPLAPLGQRIAVARDEAFSFSYWHMLQDWRSAGAEVVPFSPLANEAPRRDVDAVFLPGGYPELHAGRLALAETFKGGVCAAAARGALVYGECGGYMVLGDSLIDIEGVAHPMLGLLKLETSFAQRKRHLGYRGLQSEIGPWRGSLKGHEFHYATTISAVGEPLFEATDGGGGMLAPMGLIAGSVMGSFAHVIEPATA